ncbi:patatin-like phospholipase family protein [Vulgatibacter incomptus]|uniref:PNPLA domain-containing protein n=1 Tax=Vulgatibacter incomptus TaxID=1391653 RepID=A0A0K1PAS8_9BACT|nr:patatin-like phospholipase family protein [Vulgatibacter incomptus]AKU90648.1 hypothetical protein AKJ08_1035 [Vulgatibacter incomptus]
MSAVERFQQVRPLEELEVALVRATLADPWALGPGEEASLRWAISLARLGEVGPPERSVSLAPDVAPFREELVRRLTDALERPDFAALGAFAPEAAARSKQLRDSLLLRHDGRLDPQSLDAELREKKLVLSLGGGGGTSYVYLGAFALLEEHGLRPSLIAATSMGAIHGLFRARSHTYDSGEVLAALRALSWSRLFRVLAIENRYGLPAALRLYLRGALLRHFQRDDGSPFTFRDLEIPMLVTLSGIRRGMLPRPLSHYEHLVEPTRLALRPWLLKSKLEEVAAATSELAKPGVLDGIAVGQEDWTNDFDVVDAAGFSCAVPGLIHYDVLRPDPRMHELLGTLFTRRDLFRLVDGGLTENVPSRAAWDAVQAGRIGSRNALILALDAFAPRLSTPLWLPLQRIAAENVRAANRYATVVRAFRQTPSPTQLIPSISTVVAAMNRGKVELSEDLPLVRKLLAPLPPLDTIARAA